MKILFGLGAVWTEESKDLELLRGILPYLDMRVKGFQFVVLVDALYRREISDRSEDAKRQRK